MPRRDTSTIAYVCLLAICATVGRGARLSLSSHRPFALLRVGEGAGITFPFSLRFTRDYTYYAEYDVRFIGEYDSILPFHRVSPTNGQATAFLRAGSGLTSGALSVPFFLALDFEDVRFQSLQVNISLNHIPMSTQHPFTVVEVPSEFVLHNVNAYTPNFLIVNPATVVPDPEEKVFLYAIGGPSYIDNDNNVRVSTDITVCKDGANLPDGEPLVVKTPYIETPEEQGKYWILEGGRGKWSSGAYELTSAFLEDFTIDRPLAFISPRTRHLDTNGAHTITVYSRPDGEPHLLEEPLTFGVKKTALSKSIRWFKDGHLVKKGTARLTIHTTAETGLYTLHRYTRKKKGWFVHIKIQLSPCPKNQQYNGKTCEDPPHTMCYNGGVLSHKYSPMCQCPPCFRGFYCEHLAPRQDPFAIRESRDFTCGQLPGGNKKCKRYKFCLGGNYGCSCGCGWHGMNCDKACRKGFYGADCSQKCNCLSSSCDRFTGRCESPTCPRGFHGFNCQVPDTVSFGFNSGE